MTARGQAKIPRLIEVQVEDRWLKATVSSVLSTQLVVFIKDLGIERFVFIREQGLTWRPRQ